MTGYNKYMEGHKIYFSDEIMILTILAVIITKVLELIDIYKIIKNKKRQPGD